MNIIKKIVDCILKVHIYKRTIKEFPQQLEEYVNEDFIDSVAAQVWEFHPQRASYGPKGSWDDIRSNSFVDIRDTAKMAIAMTIDGINKNKVFKIVGDKSNEETNE